MSSSEKRLHGVLRSSGAFVCLATLLPFLKVRSWWVRAFDFPRLQVATLGAATLLGGLPGSRRLRPADKLLLGGVGVSIAAQLLQILKYTPLVKQQVLSSSAPAPGSKLSLLVSNVRMKNRRVDLVLNLVKEVQPDIVLLIESNGRWLEEISELDARYPWNVKVPRENTYGMALYSRLEMLQSETRHLVQRDVPSVRARIRLGNGRTFWLYAVHPRPPVRANVEGDLDFPGAGKRDAELVRVALEVQRMAEPVLVAGDFNDVAWSHTTRHFQRVGKLLDPRVGRGLFSTYHAEHRWLRFPVDHLFHSKEFTLVNFARGPWVGSDHFPILLELSLEKVPVQRPPERHEDDMEEAVEKATNPE